MLTYKIKGEILENIEDTKVEVHGFVPEFSIADLKKNIETNKKQLSGVDGNLSYLAKKIENIETHHAFVKEMSEQDLFTAHMYQDSLETKKKFDIAKEQLENQIKADEEELAEIYNQIPELHKPSADVVEGEVTLKENE
jgi:acylphosphatase